MSLLNYITESGKCYVVCQKCGCENFLGYVKSEKDEIELYRRWLQNGARCSVCGESLEDVLTHLLMILEEDEE